MRYLRCAVVRGDAAVLVAKKHLTCFERHAGRPQPPTERMLQVVNAQMLKSPRCFFAYTLNESERAGVLRHLIVHGDLSAYGLVNAVTHYSDDLEDYDLATEFEALGGKLIELSANEWEELAEAA